MSFINLLKYLGGVTVSDEVIRESQGKAGTTHGKKGHSDPGPTWGGKAGHSDSGSTWGGKEGHSDSGSKK